MNDTTASDCTCPSALTASVAELDAFLDGDCVEPLTLAQSEAAALVLQELKRRMQATPAAPGIDLRNAILQLREDALHMKDPGDTVNAYDRVLRLIDASPKGVMCGGCGNADEAQRCIGCMHDFRGGCGACGDGCVTNPGGCVVAEQSPPVASPKVGSTDAEPMFYIQDTRSFVGNCPVWWGPNGNGYVTRLDEAGRFTEQEAIAQNRTRDTDVPWPCAEIDKLGRITVDVQHMRPRRERLAELQATSAEVGS